MAIGLGCAHELPRRSEGARCEWWIGGRAVTVADRRREPARARASARARERLLRAQA